MNNFLLFCGPAILALFIALVIASLVKPLALACIIITVTYSAAACVVTLNAYRFSPAEMWVGVCVYAPLVGISAVSLVAFIGLSIVVLF